MEGLELPDTLWYSRLIVILQDRSLFNLVEMEYRGITPSNVVVTRWMKDEIGSKVRANCEKDGGLVSSLLRLYPGRSESSNGICEVEEAMWMCCGAEFLEVKAVAEEGDWHFLKEPLLTVPIF